MAKMARAAVLTGPRGPIEVRSYEIPDPDPGTFVIRVDMTGICGTDVHIYHGRLPTTEYPIVLGHEVTGTIARLGEGVETDYLGRPVSIGDRVVLMPSVSCGKCRYCNVLKTPGRCPNRKPSYGFKGLADSFPQLTGGYAEYLHAANVGTVFFKTDLPEHIAVLLEPLSIALHAVQRANVGLGSTVVVQGTGAIGLLSVACAKLAGASRIVAIGGPAGRLALASEFGADATIDIGDVTDLDQRLRLVREYLDSELGASAVIECAGVPSAFLEGINYVADGGVLSEVGHFTDNGEVMFNPYHHLLRRNIRLEGCFGSGGIRQFCTGLEILERGTLPFEKMVSHRVALTDLEAAFASLSKGYRLDGRDAVKVVVDPHL